MLLDLVNEVITAQGLAPQVLTATAQGTAQDFSDAHVAMNAIIDVGAITTANVTSLVVQIEECATTNGTFVLIPGMIATATATTTAANLHQVVRGLRTSRYVRANAITFAVTTTTGAFPVSVELVSQRKLQGSGSTLYSGADLYPSS